MESNRSERTRRRERRIQDHTETICRRSKRTGTTTEGAACLDDAEEEGAVLLREDGLGVRQQLLADDLQRWYTTRISPKGEANKQVRGSQTKPSTDADQAHTQR